MVAVVIKLFRHGSQDNKGHLDAVVIKLFRHVHKTNASQCPFRTRRNRKEKKAKITAKKPQKKDDHCIHSLVKASFTTPAVCAILRSASTQAHTTRHDRLESRLVGP